MSHEKWAMSLYLAAKSISSKLKAQIAKKLTKL